jgi:hypothetical protein
MLSSIDDWMGPKSGVDVVCEQNLPMPEIKPRLFGPWPNHPKFTTQNFGGSKITISTSRACTSDEATKNAYWMSPVACSAGGYYMANILYSCYCSQYLYDYALAQCSCKLLSPAAHSLIIDTWLDNTKIRLTKRGYDMAINIYLHINTCWIKRQSWDANVTHIK